MYDGAEERNCLKVLRNKLFLLPKADCNKIVADLCKNSERITDGFAYYLPGPPF